MFEKDPSLETIKDGMPEPPPDRTASQKRMRLILLAILGIVLVLATMNLMASPVGDQILSTGAITGTVLTSQGEPFHGEVLILGTNQTVQTNPDGSFRIDRAPAGEQSLIILAEEGGNEVKVNVTSGGTLNLGVVKFTETATP